jgi:hypothetical protein
MTKVTIKALPHSPAVETVGDQRIKQLFMQIIENQKSLKRQLEEVQKAVQELTRR